MSRSKLTDEKREAIADSVADGLSGEVAAGCEGIGRRTYFDWMARGRKADLLEELGKDIAESEVPYLAFFAAIKHSQDKFEKQALSDIRDAVDSEGNHKNLIWVLERTRPDRYGNKLTVEVKDRASAEFLALLRERLDPREYQKVVACLAGEGSEEGSGDDEDDGEDIPAAYPLD